MTLSRATRALFERVANQARHRCGYCLTRESIVGAPMEVDHLIPESKGGQTEEENLWLACPRCNAYKADRIAARDPMSGRMVKLFNPRRQIWANHFTWSSAGDEIIGMTATGRKPRGTRCCAPRVDHCGMASSRRLMLRET